MVSIDCGNAMLLDGMRVGETELEMVQRHVRQGEKHVSRQLEIIADMEFRNQWTGVAEDLYSTLKIAFEPIRRILNR